MYSLGAAPTTKFGALQTVTYEQGPQHPLRRATRGLFKREHRFARRNPIGDGKGAIDEYDTQQLNRIGQSTKNSGFNANEDTSIRRTKQSH